MTAESAGLTTRRTLGAGPVLRAGSRGLYREVAELPGESHVVRRDLVGDSGHDEVEPTRPIIADEPNALETRALTKEIDRFVLKEATVHFGDPDARSAARSCARRANGR